MRILVTGGAGFIGSNFVRLTLVTRPDVSIVVLDALTYAGSLENLSGLEGKYEFVHGNILDSALVDSLVGRVDQVVHFAAESHNDNSLKDPKPFIDTNILGTYELIQACVKHDVKFHHISTDEVYGELHNPEEFFLETTPYDPRSPYSASKASSDHFVRAFHETYGLPTVITNCSNNYGPNHFPEKLIPLMIHNIINNKPLPVYGKGENVRDWLYVIDHARAIDTVFHDGKIGETYNIGGFNEWKNIDLVHLLCKIMDEKLGRAAGTSVQLITYVTDRAGHDLRYAIDANKIMKELGWKPSLQFAEGLEKTVDWYLSNEKWLNDVTSGDYQKYYTNMYQGR